MEDKQVKEEWVVVWFPPKVSQRQRAFKAEGRALDFAKDGVVEREQVSDWSPLVEHRIVTTYSETKIVYNSADEVING